MKNGKMKIYVASSWRNKKQPEVVRILREHGYDVYDFRNPVEGNNGFHLSEIDEDWLNWTPKQFISKLQHVYADFGFGQDFHAMESSDVCILVLPCGKSAHLEAGYFVGAGKLLFILLDKEKFEPELMYKMANAICVSVDELLKELEVYV